MKEECKNLIKEVEDILEKELTSEMTKIKEAGKFAPGQVDTLKNAAKLMVAFKELKEGEEYNTHSMMSMNAYAPRRNPNNGRYMSGDYMLDRSGHSIKDRMIAGLEDVMGVAKNEYEANMISNVISYVNRME